MKCPLLEVSPMFLQRRTSLRYRSLNQTITSQHIYFRKCKFNPSFNKIKNFCLWIPSSSPVRARNAWSSEFTKIKVSKQKIISYICWFVQIDFVLVKKFTSWSSEKIWAAEVESNVFRKVSRPSEIVYL